MGFTDDTTSELGFWCEPDIIAVTGDKTGGASDVLELGAQTHLRCSRALTSASGTVIDILPKTAVKVGISILQFATDFSFSGGGVSLN